MAHAQRQLNTVGGAFRGVQGVGSPPGEGMQETAESGVKPPLCVYRCALSAARSAASPTVWR
eukprot:2440475-Alexandrium_andersonii.AAC.1